MDLIALSIGGSLGLIVGALLGRFCSLIGLC